MVRYIISGDGFQMIGLVAHEDGKCVRTSDCVFLGHAFFQAIKWLVQDN